MFLPRVSLIPRKSDVLATFPDTSEDETTGLHHSTAYFEPKKNVPFERHILILPLSYVMNLSTLCSPFATVGEELVTTRRKSKRNDQGSASGHVLFTEPST